MDHEDILKHELDGLFVIHHQRCVSFRVAARRFVVAEGVAANAHRGGGDANAIGASRVECVRLLCV